VIVLSRVSFFCHSKVSDTDEALNISGEAFGMRTFFL
jgi:hypothetical protein